jgi:hypothetical protein
VEVVTLDVPLIEGLDAESIDFLDLVFRLERGFGVKIPRGRSSSTRAAICRRRSSSRKAWSPRSV